MKDREKKILKLELLDRTLTFPWASPFSTVDRVSNFYSYSFTECHSDSRFCMKVCKD